MLPSIRWKIVKIVIMHVLSILHIVKKWTYTSRWANTPVPLPCFPWPMTSPTVCFSVGPTGWSTQKYKYKEQRSTNYPQPQCGTHIRRMGVPLKLPLSLLHCVVISSHEKQIMWRHVKVVELGSWELILSKDWMDLWHSGTWHSGTVA